METILPTSRISMGLSEDLIFHACTLPHGSRWWYSNSLLPPGAGLGRGLTFWAGSLSSISRLVEAGSTLIPLLSNVSSLFRGADLPSPTQCNQQVHSGSPVGIVLARLSWDLVFHFLPGSSRWCSDFSTRVVSVESSCELCLHLHLQSMRLSEVRSGTSWHSASSSLLSWCRRGPFRRVSFCPHPAASRWYE